jgi:hypothetical protein
MSAGGAERTVVSAHRTARHQEVTSMKRLLTICLLALLIVPAAASAMRPLEAPPLNYSNNPATATPVVHQVRIVTNSNDNTLPIALGAIALGVSLIGFGYLTYRGRPMPAARN